jgi:hypothetical protein
VLSVRPVVQKPIMLFAIFVILLFNLIYYVDPVGTRAFLERIYPALTILLLCGAIGLMVGYGRPINLIDLVMLCAINKKRFIIGKQHLYSPDHKSRGNLN